MPLSDDDQKETDLPCCISHAFFNAASRNPNRIAIVHATGGIRLCRRLHDVLRGTAAVSEVNELFEASRLSSSPPIYDGDMRYTYGDILRAVEALSIRIRCVLDGGDDPDVIRPKGFLGGTKSCMMQKLGKHFPQIVGICIAPSVEYIVCVLAVLRCGEAFLPLDPLWPEGRIKSLTLSSRTALVVVCAHTTSSIGKYQGISFDWMSEESSCSLLYLSMDKCLVDELPCNVLNWPCEAENPRLFCYLIYTSGSTGKPKGVCGTERGLINRYTWMQRFYPIDISDILFFKTSIVFIDHIQEFLASILTCAMLVIPPFYDTKTNPAYIIYALKAYNISRLTAVPSLMRTIIPFIQRLSLIGLEILLKVLVLSGESLSISLWRSLCNLLPDTMILNLYGSTEVSGDCMYFDCKSLPQILMVEDLETVPIGVPISNCDVICDESETPEEGELCVGGSCLFAGYLDDLYLHHFEDMNSSQLHFRTGDFARWLRTGVYVFIGRKDRTLKLNGQRVALEEIEATLREHPTISDVAVVRHGNANDYMYFRAFIVLKANEIVPKNLSISISTKNIHEDFIVDLRKWLLNKLPLVMIPSAYIFINSLPSTPTAKVDYTFLEGLFIEKHTSEYDGSTYLHDHMQIIKEAFCNALMVEDVNESDDFFLLGGNSLAAAQVAHSLNIDMRLLYVVSTPSGLLNAMYSENSDGIKQNDGIDTEKGKKTRESDDKKRKRKPMLLGDDGSPCNPKALRLDSHVSPDSKTSTHSNAGIWTCNYCSDWKCSFSRCNFLRCGTKPNLVNTLHACMTEISSNSTGFLKELWKVPLSSCIDASPLLLLKDGCFHLFIGSHSHIFLCVEGTSGEVKWEVKLDGRIECSAAMTDDFSQVVVGCYKGRIYFIDSKSGVICWVFQTDGEVKTQPVAYNNLIWCGSHDHYLYALDYHQQSCVYKILCGGSIYGSPSIDTERKKLYVASTNGRVTALCIEASTFWTLWSYEVGTPIFGSPCLDPLSGNVICCLVNGGVLALDSKGSVVWKATTGGPIFAGACMSSVLPSQVLVCSRDGSVYSLERESGQFLWEYNTGSPITASAYVDEHIELPNPSHLPDRLVCICSSSGQIHVLRINPNPMKCSNQEGSSKTSSVELFASIDLPGDIFSSPVMIGGRIFVGCRDDYLHCMAIVW